MDRFLLAERHIDDRRIEAGDHLAGAAGEFDRLAAIVARIELRAVVEGAAIMRLDLLA